MHSTPAFPSSLTPSTHRLFARLLPAAALLLASICQSISTAGQPAPSWDVFVRTFIEDYFAANPTFAVYQGRHDFDGRLPDWSETGIRSDISQLKRHRTAALAFAAGRLTKDQAFERDHLVAFIDSELFWLETADWPHVNPAHYAWALDPDVYVSREYAPLAQRLEAYTRYARAVPAALTQVKTNLRGGQRRAAGPPGRF